MPAETETTICPYCRRPVSVPEEWRMVECPSCHQVITRMSDDANYD